MREGYKKPVIHSEEIEIGTYGFYGDTACDDSDDDCGPI